MAHLGGETFLQKEQDGAKKATILVLFAFLAGLFLTALPASADPGEHSLGLGIGDEILFGNFSSNFPDSMAFQLNYNYDASPLIGLTVMASLGSHSNAITGGSLGIDGLTPDLRFNLAKFETLTFYAMSGFGLYKISESFGGSTPSASVTTIGFNLGGGFELRLAKHFAFGTSLDFYNIFSKTDDSTAAANGGTGTTVGGTYMHLMLNFSYIF
jgi:hypothetical protein